MKHYKPVKTNPEGGKLKGIRGEAISFNSNPFTCNNDDCCTHYPDALIVIQDGIILDIGNYNVMKQRYTDISDIDQYTDAVILPGFIDCHTHYVQSPMVGSYGDTLLNWLNSYTFPTEAKFSDRRFADEVAKMFFRHILSQGTTTANIFATTFGPSVDAIFEESERYNTRIISGKVLQDRNLPDNLKDKSAEESILISEKLLNKWHKRGRQLYAVTPRFAPTSTPLQLRLAGELYRCHMQNGVYMHTHLDEAHDEIEWVRDLFPEAENYTDVYEMHGLLGPTSVFAHCCLVKETEWRHLHNAGCGIAHCPSSNLFLGDGEFKFWEAVNQERPCNIGIGTDIGGGTNFSVFRQLGDAYNVSMLHSRPLGIMQSLYMATRGGAEVLSLQDKIGSLAPGHEADITVLDLAPSEFAGWRMQFARNIFEKLFILQTLSPDNIVLSTYVSGIKVFDRQQECKFMYT